MSRENVELVRRMYEAYLRGDVEGSLAYFHPDVEVDFSVRVDSKVGRGRQALAEVVGSWQGTWDDYSEEIEEIRDLGDTVCVAALQRGRGKGSGAALESRFAGLYEIEDGQITRVAMYMSLDEALRAAEVSEAS